MNPTVLYDARSLQPQFRHWGVGVFIGNLVPRLSPDFHMTGRSLHFADADEHNISTWPAVPKLGTNALFEVSTFGAPHFDLYWGTNHHLPQAVPRNRTVLTVHDLLLLRYPSDQPKTPYFASRFVSSLRRATSIIAISNTTASDLIDTFPWVKNKLTVALQGYEPNMPTEQDIAFIQERYPMPYVVILGGHRPRKNISLGIKAAMKLREKGIPLHVLITGSTHGSFQPLINQHSEAIIQTGVLSRGQVAAVLKNAQALLFSSLYEGFGLPLLEAMSAGCPVLALDTPIHREVGGKGLWLLSDDPDDWAKALYQAMYESDLRSDLVDAGLENLKRFDWQQTTEIYTQVFREALA